MLSIPINFPDKLINGVLNIAKQQYVQIWFELKNFFSFFNPDVFFLIKFFILSLSFLLLIFILILIAKTGYWTEIIFDDLTAFVIGEKKSKKEKKEIWNEIEKIAKRGDKENLKIAIIKANNLLEKIINEKGIEKENFEEKLMYFLKEENILEIFKDLKKAYLFEEFIKNDKENNFSLDQAKIFLEVYRQIFRKLGYIN